MRLEMLKPETVTTNHNSQCRKTRTPCSSWLPSAPPRPPRPPTGPAGAAGNDIEPRRKCFRDVPLMKSITMLLHIYLQFILHYLIRCNVNIKLKKFSRHLSYFEVLYSTDHIFTEKGQILDHFYDRIFVI